MLVFILNISLGLKIGLYVSDKLISTNTNFISTLKKTSFEKKDLIFTNSSKASITVLNIFISFSFIKTSEYPLFSLYLYFLIPACI